MSFLSFCPFERRARWWGKEEVREIYNLLVSSR